MHRPGRARLSFAVFLVALVTLMVELLLIRLFDVVLVNNLGYMIISCALFAFGLSGVYATLRPFDDPERADRHLAGLGVLLALSCALQMPLLNLNPLDMQRVVETPVLQAVCFFFVYLTVSSPFFFAGLILARVFTVHARRIRTLYFFDLVGAAVGAVIIVPLIRPLGPGGLLLAAGGLALIAAALLLGRGRYLVLAAAVAAVAVAVPLAGNGYYEFRPHLDKRGVRSAFESETIERTVWDPVSKIDVIPVEDRHAGWVPAKHVSYDGGSQSSHLFSLDGDFAALRAELDANVENADRHFWNRTVPLSHWFKADTAADVLIIGSAAGQETKAALTYGAGHVDAVEMVAAVVELVTGPYADYIGGLFRDPRVEVTVGEGRTFLRGTERTYDIIQIFSNHTSSSISAGNGVADTIYLQTADAYVEYFTHLKGDGILQVNRNLYPRTITTAALAWKWLGRKDFREHVVVYELDHNDALPTILIKMSPWTEEEIARLDRYMLAPIAGNRYVMMENPLDSEHSFLIDDFYDRPEAPELMDRVDYIVRPATDDRPYFDFIRRKLTRLEADPARFLDRGTAGRLNAQIKAGLPYDIIHFVVTGAAALVFALLFVFVPLLASPAGRASWPHKFTSIFYFSCLGAGFIIIELTLIQIFMRLIGFPLYAYSVVIFAMLLAAGLGSLSADRLDISPRRRWGVPFVGLLVCGAALWLAQPAISGAFLAAPLAVRMLVAAAMIFPMAFFMGMPLPLGILALTPQPRGAIAWAWAMNGLFTVIGGLIAAVGSIYLGFAMILLIGFAIYVAAAVAFLPLRRMQTAGEAPGAVRGPLPAAEPV